MYQLQRGDKIIEYRLSTKNVHIKDSYKITNKELMKDIISAIRFNAAVLGYQYKRTEDSWLNEWVAHNFLYEHSIAKSRTGSVDLNENESSLKLFGYNILAKFYREKG